MPLVATGAVYARTRSWKVKSAGLILALLALPSCTPPGDTPAPLEAATSAGAAPQQAADDGSYLEQIDPLGGQWRVSRIGEEDFTRFNPWIGFSGGGFLNHGAGCGGGYPAFYRLAGDRIEITRLEAVRTGKCAGTPELANGTAAFRAAAAASERRLAEFIDQLDTWSRQGAVLTLTARDGRRAVLTHPAEPHPELAGRWLIESIGGAALVTERRPAILSIAMNNIGVHADCNSMGTAFTIPAPGKIAVAGPIMGTAIGCAPEDQAEDDLMARAIRSATGYRLEGERLVLTGGPGMIARRPPPPDRRLAGEYQSCGNTPLGAYQEGPITLAIDSHTIRDNAGCTAEYRADGPVLTLTLGDAPACRVKAPPFVPGQPIGVGGNVSALAVMKPDGFGFDEQGLLILRTARGHLTMCRKGSPPPFGS
jgi:heat shock protein HslJ